VRERFLTPRLRFRSYEEMNAWLLDRCIAWAKAHRHIDQSERTIWDVFEEERGKLVGYRGSFDGLHCVPASVSKTCTVRFDNNKYSVLSTAVGRPVEIQAYADRIVIRQDGTIVGEHARSFGRGETVYNPWHYVPVLARKPGALRNDAPFQDWELPPAMERVRRRLKAADNGDRQMVLILAAVLSDGIDAVEAACQQALAENVCSSAVVLNILARRRDPAPDVTIPHTRCAASATRAAGRLRPLRQPQEGKLMERTEVLTDGHAEVLRHARRISYRARVNFGRDARPMTLG